MEFTFGLIGKTLKHSFSQQYFNHKFERENLSQYKFANFELPQISDIPELIKQHKSLLGFCITIPFKKDIISYLNKAFSPVLEIDACNCVVLKNGTLIGYNTDVIGFKLSLVKKLKPHHQRALILGTGGVARAVKYVLEELHIKYVTISRTINENTYNYEQLKKNFHLQDFPLIINCTPLGTYPHAETFPDINYEQINSQHLLFDLVYNPPLTAFLQRGQLQQAEILNGYEMLTIQAEENFKLWTSNLANC